MNRLAFLSLSLLVVGCTAAERRNSEKLVAEVLISDDQETQLGLQVHEQLKKENTKFLENPVVEMYVETVARKLLAQADKERKLEWKWFVIDDPNTVNAFATPGGRIYVYTGLLMAADSEAEIVGVLGHEIGHVVARHSARQLVSSYGLETVINVALGKSAEDTAKIAATLAGKTAQLAYGRDMELEADEYGARFSSGANYDPHALAGFFEKLKAKFGDTGPVLTLFSTHPANSERIAKINEFIVMQKLSGSDTGAERLAPVKAALGKK